MLKKNNNEKNILNNNLTEEQKKDLEIIKKKQERNKKDNDLKNEAVNYLKKIENNNNNVENLEGKKLNYWERQKLESQKRLDDMKQMKNIIDKLENRKEEIKYEKNEMTSQEKKNIGRMINAMGNGPINANNVLIQQMMINKKTEK
jgi:hypothetical protein